MLGDNIGFAIGRFGGRALILRYGARIGLTEGRLARVEGFFRRFGGEVVLGARFFAVVRQDAKEGRASFLERRPPRYQGR